MRAAALVLALPLMAASQGKLELQSALPLEGQEFIQPSGLAFSGSDLYLASAGHDEALFLLELQSDKALYRPAIKVKPPEDAEGRKLAYRALAANPDGGFFLLSEAACRILKVTPRGAADWEGPQLLQAGVDKGLFAGEASGAEGLVRLGPGKFLVAASREPRGLIELDLSGKEPDARAFVLGKSKVPLPKGRKPDLSDLADDGGRLLALSAASDAVIRLEKKGEGYVEDGWLGFGHVTGDAKYRYRGLKMGLARALAVDAGHIYVVLDNKGVARESDAADKRPLLLVFKKPG